MDFDLASYFIGCGAGMITLTATVMAFRWAFRPWRFPKRPDLHISIRALDLASAQLYEIVDRHGTPTGRRRRP